MLRVRAPFLLGDGSSISIQASEFHHCSPRDNTGPYTHFEVWPDHAVAGWADYAQGDGDDAPYACVPREQVQLYIALHGGFTFNDVFHNSRFVY